MATLEAVLGQISQSAQSLQSITFGPPQIFVNALLQNHDITALIRDTEAHERALFTVSQPPPAPRAIDPSAKDRRRTTVAEQQPPQYGQDSRFPRRNTAVAAVLGGDLMHQIRRGGGVDGSGLKGDSELDVELLLQGAEKLCRVYPIPGAQEKIDEMRTRHSRLSRSIYGLERQSAQQTAQLAALGRLDDDFDEQTVTQKDTNTQPDETGNELTYLTAEDVRQEEMLIRELEQRKASLEEMIRRGQEEWTAE